MLNEKDFLSIEVARMYYELDKTQQEIAKILTISRPTVSKLLKYAKEKNYVQISIHHPIENNQLLEQVLMDKYKLKAVKIASTTSTNDAQDISYETIGKEAANYIHSIVKSDMRIGISWGETIYHVSRYLQKKNVQNVEISQLKGGMNLVEANTHDQEIMQAFVKNYNASGQYIPLPIVFESVEAKNIMMNEKTIQKINEKIQHIDIALYTIGTITKDSMLFKANAITEEEFHLLKAQAVCDICSRFINEDGQIVNQDLNNRTYGIALEQLAKVPYSILIASGENKLKGIHTVLSNKIPNIFVTDYLTAQKLITL